MSCVNHSAGGRNWIRRKWGRKRKLRARASPFDWRINSSDSIAITTLYLYSFWFYIYGSICSRSFLGREWGSPWYEWPWEFQFQVASDSFISISNAIAFFLSSNTVKIEQQLSLQLLLWLLLLLRLLLPFQLDVFVRPKGPAARYQRWYPSCSMLPISSDRPDGFGTLFTWPCVSSHTTDISFYFFMGLYRRMDPYRRYSNGRDLHTQKNQMGP